MRTAHTHARRALHTHPDPEAHEAWGWHGRTLGAPVTTDHGRRWLRVAATPIDQLIDTFWNGAIDAHRAIPAAVPRPRLLRWHDWTDGTWTYRAELYEHATAGTIADHAAITTPPALTSGWWATVGTALTTIATVNTIRMTVQPGFLAWSMPHYLGIPSNDHPGQPWTTAHGDFHYANLCAPELQILDWEGWGLAPAGYDAATLHTYSLLAPDAAADISHHLTDLLHTPAGRHAELVVITELLHACEHGINTALAAPLHHRARALSAGTGASR
ncbi:hypothetical protein [Solwaraspora sp. WMMA2065]|uniref:hypothetical protein n=1 Tax=Solwaraspora sp. WMMA2065 TaxID=3015166 RepID=UPI00259B7787|nr:hypothetical protein [Solwaraspora sp. WMMA2065]WJK33096.1 hypothetical protein O7610_20565 [Solwaraspora sp. WMMA2065]